MINGWTSRIQIVGAILALLFSLYGMIDLARHNQSIPMEIVAISAGAAGFLYGVTNIFPRSGDAVRDVITRTKQDTSVIDEPLGHDMKAGN